MLLVVAICDAEGDEGANPSNSGEPTNDEEDPEPHASFRSTFLLDSCRYHIVALRAIDCDRCSWPHLRQLWLVVVTNDYDSSCLGGLHCFLVFQINSKFVYINYSNTGIN